MSLQPTASQNLDRTTTAPFLLRLFWRQHRSLEPSEFSIAPPADTSAISDYSSLLPSSIRQQSVQIYTWPTCTLSELTGLLTSVLPEGLLPSPAVGTRLVFKLIFPDTRAEVREGGRGKWIDKPLGSVVIGGQHQDDGDGDMQEPPLEGDASKTLGDARFVIGDYVACSIYPPGPDGRVVSVPAGGSSYGRGGPVRDGYGPPSRGGPPPMRENGFGGGYGGGYGGRGGYRGGGRGGGGGFGSAPPSGEWRRGERPPAGYGGARGDGGGGYGRGRGGRPY